MARVSNIGPSLDRISDLPSNVIHKILVLLPINEAVRTSTLSTKWKEKWRTIPQVIVDENLLPDHYYRWHDSIINSILMKHEGIIEKFSFSVEVRDFLNVNTWIWRLKQKGIKELFLFYWRGHGNEVPSILFSCTELRKLGLRHCYLTPPRFFRGFQCLISLELNKVEIQTCDFEKLISSCPLLEKLTLKKWSCEGHLRINVPKLNYFCFDGQFISMSLNTPVLEVLSINLHQKIHKYSSSDHNPFDLRFKFCGLPSGIKELYVGCQFQKYLAACDRSTEFVTYSHLRTLQLDEFCFEKLEQVRCLVTLIGSSLNLTTLDITACGCESEAMLGPVTKFWEEKNNAPNLLVLKELKKVTVRSFRGKDPEMKFVQYVMANSPAPEEMTVEFVKKSPKLDVTKNERKRNPPTKLEKMRVELVKNRVTKNERKRNACKFEEEDHVKGILQLLCKASTQLKFINGAKNHESNSSGGDEDGCSDDGPDSCGSYTGDSD